MPPGTDIQQTDSHSSQTTPGPEPDLQALKQQYSLDRHAGSQQNTIRSRPKHHYRGNGPGPAVLPFGVPAIDRHLPPGGLSCHGLHDIVWQPGGHATGFAAWLAGGFLRLWQQRRPGPVKRTGQVLWIRKPHNPDDGHLFGPGLSDYGLPMDSVWMLACKQEEDAFWCCEEALKTRHFAAIICEGQKEAARPGPVILRRLQLAAERAGTPLLLLRPLPADKQPRGQDMTDLARRLPSPAMTRWQIAPHMTDDDTATSVSADNFFQNKTGWHLSLLRCRGADAAAWPVWLDHETVSLHLATPSSGGTASAPSPA